MANKSWKLDKKSSNKELRKFNINHNFDYFDLFD